MVDGYFGYCWFGWIGGCFFCCFDQWVMDVIVFLFLFGCVLFFCDNFDWCIVFCFVVVFNVGGMGDFCVMNC